MTREALANGADLLAFSHFPTVEMSQEVLRLVQQRRQMLKEIWVRDDPHPRFAGMHKDSKAKLADADALEARIRTLCQPRKILVHLAPAPAK